MLKLLFHSPLLRSCLFFFTCAVPTGAAASVTSVEVQKLYVGIVGRPADFSGLNYYTSNSSATVTSVGAAMSNSSEFLALTAGMSTAQVVMFLFQNIFSRGATSPETSYWSSNIDSGAVTVGGAAWFISSNATGADLLVWNYKVDAAEAFYSALDTAPEIIGYSGSGPASVGRAYLARIYDNATYLAETAPAALNATVQQAIEAGYTPTRTATRTATATLTRSPTRTPSPTNTVSPIQTPSVTRTPSPIQTSSSTVTPSPSMTLTLTVTTTVDLSVVPSPAAATATPETGGVQGTAAPVVMGPVPAKRGEAVCLGSNRAVSGGRWVVYNTSSPPERIASLSFGAEARCMATGGLAPGVYFVDCATEFADGGGDRRFIKVVVLP